MATIRRPGKFEDETHFVEARWESAMDGCADETFEDGETSVDVFRIDATDRALYPDDIDADDVGKFLLIWESEQGFVNSRIVDQAELDRIQAACAEDQEEECDG